LLSSTKGEAQYFSAENQKLKDENTAFLADIQALKDQLVFKQEAEAVAAEEKKKSTTGYERYQANAQNLVNASKESNRSLVLNPMKQVLLSCREATEECEAIEDDPEIPEEDKEALFDIKTNLSKYLTSLMKAAKDHASIKGSDKTEKQIEKELSKLSFCISDLYELIKIIDSGANPLHQSLSLKRQTLKSESQEPLPPFELPELHVISN
jgi:uncharacterized protein YcfL